MVKLLCGTLACGVLTLLLIPLRAEPPAGGRPERTAREKELADEATKLLGEVRPLYFVGKLTAAREKCAEALAKWRMVYPPDRYKDGGPELAACLSIMGILHQAMGEPAEALTWYEQALAMNRKLYPPERFKDGHDSVATSLHNMASVLQAMGEPARALAYQEEAVAMYRTLFPPEKFKDGAPALANSLNNLGVLLQSLGEPARALAYYEQALAMRRGLYPPEKFKDGHLDIAGSLNNVGFALVDLGEPAKALPYYEQALAMYRAMYPEEKFKDGHPALANAVSSMGFVHEAMGEPAKALGDFEQSLVLYRKLYPSDRFKDGHPDLARNLNNIGAVLQAMGKPAEALTYYEQGLAMRRKLYPAERFKDGHPDLALSLTNVGKAREAMGEPRKALADFEQALALRWRLSRREMGGASEAQALAYRRAQHDEEDRYLSVAAEVPPSAALYPPLWHLRGGVLPLLQARHRAVLARLATSADDRKTYADLVAVRGKISRLQADSPADEKRQNERDRALAALDEEQDRLERKLAKDLPAFRRLQGLAEKGPAELSRALPDGGAFVDLIRYTHWQKGRPVGRRYGAFVVVPGRDAVVLQVGDAGPIDEAVAAWRKHVAAGEESLAPAKLRELLWDRVARELPARTKTVYLCPDGDLARLPFAALPGSKKGTVLLEDYALAVVPSGSWLLEQLLYPASMSEGPGRVLAVGGVAYGAASGGGKEDYAPLPGTAREVRRVLDAFGPDGGEALSGPAATVTAVREGLAKARYAHLATHGYFDEKALTAERRRLRDSLERWSSRADGPLAGVGSRNPAGYVGLALAGANDPGKAGPHGGVLTGLGVVDLPLEGLRLCVLSACETGLGELTEGEGVIGLQRAFHAAGCPDVVGSLWRVDDAATAALMAQFYHELRANKRPPLEALREAQLTVYRHPERVGDLAGERGRPALDAAAKLGSAAAPGEKAKTAPTRLWAAFVLSGPGTGN
ncbi:MAG TPA: CHAT domain-containing protein [Gemmataceae bacterium]|nr:CHAT domain-containing protein [Gemmataceae bacterium]